MGGMVVKGSLQKDLQNLTYHFQLTDGGASFPVYFKGVPPDLFVEGKGAVVEGRVGSDGVFHATTIMAKHAEDYSPHADGKTRQQKFCSRQGSRRQVTATLGHSSILIAFVAALIGIVSPIVAARSAGDRFRAVARYAIFGQFVFVTVAAVGADLWSGRHRLLDQVRRLQHHPRDADLLSRHRTVGRARRLALALGMDTDHLRRHRRLGLSPAPP